MSVSLSLIRSLPKADLHSHIDGSVPIRELFAIARKHRRRLMAPSGHELMTPRELLEHVRGPGYSALLRDIVGRFFPLVGIMQTEEVLREVGTAYVRELRNHGVSYAEGRFAPQYHTREGLTHGQAISALADGLAEGSEKYGVRVGLIVAIGREADPRTGKEVVLAAARSRKAVALDLGGPEEQNPPEKFVEAFNAATLSGLKKTVHAGEGAGSVRQNLKNIRAAVELLGADRLGHAIDIVGEESLVRLVRARKVALEMNPVSNLVLNKIRDLKQLGIDALLQSGVIVTVNSDDPALWPAGSIDHVLTRVCRSFGFGSHGLDRLITNSFRSSFADRRTKEGLLEDYVRARRRLG